MADNVPIESDAEKRVRSLAARVRQLRDLRGDDTFEAEPFARPTGPNFRAAALRRGEAPLTTARPGPPQFAPVARPDEDRGFRRPQVRRLGDERLPDLAFARVRPPEAPEPTTGIGRFTDVIPEFEPPAPEPAPETATERRTRDQLLRAAADVPVTERFADLTRRIGEANERKRAGPQPVAIGTPPQETVDDIVREVLGDGGLDKTLDALSIIQTIDETAVSLLLSVTSSDHKRRAEELRRQGFNTLEAARMAYNEIPRAESLRLLEQMVLSPLNLLPGIGFAGAIGRVTTRAAATITRVAKVGVTLARAVPEGQIARAVTGEALEEVATGAISTPRGLRAAAGAAEEVPGARSREVVPEASRARRLAAGEEPTATAGEPPRPPGEPPAPPTEPPVPGQPRPETSSALSRAHVITEADLPAAIAGIADRVPLLGKLRRFYRPGLDLPREMLDSHVAMVGVRAEFAQKAIATRRPILREVDALFGPGSVKGGQTTTRFIGTAEEAANPITGTLKDIADNPQLYQLTDEQAEFLLRFNARNDEVLRLANEGYGTDIGRFPPNEGGAFLPNIDIGAEAEAIREALGGSSGRALQSGRGKTRIFQTARERMASDAGFSPETNVRKMVHGMDEFKGNASASQTFRAGVGGKNKLEVLQETHPALAARMANLQADLASLRGKLTRTDSLIDDAIEEFSRSPMADEDLLGLVDTFDLEISKGFHAMDLPELKGAIVRAKDAIQDLRPAWKNANPHGWTFVGDGVYRYFPAEDAAKLRKLLETERGGFASFVDYWRGTVLAGDTSPITGIQAPLSFLFDPFGASKQWTGGLGRSIAQGDVFAAFKVDTLAADIAANPRWNEFAFFMGRPTFGGRPEEMARSFLELIPKAGPLIKAGNDAMFVALMRRAFRMWDDTADSLLKHGTVATPAQADAAAMDMVTKVIPIISPARLGQSQARAQAFRVPVTSISFLAKPIELSLDAARGMAKLVTGQTLTPRELLGVRMAVTIASTVEAISVGTALYAAEQLGIDKTEAIKNTLPGGKWFMSAVLPDGNSIPIGGPFRSLANAMIPREVEGVPFPVPFAGVPNFLRGKITPFISTHLEQFKNADYFGNNIRLKDASFAENLLRTLAYELEGAAPISVGAIAEGVRLDRPLGETVREVFAQFGGMGLRQQTPFQERDVGVENWARANGIAATSYYDLGRRDKARYNEEQPESAQAIREETRRRAKNGDERSIIRQIRFDITDRRYESERALVNELMAGAIPGVDNDNRREVLSAFRRAYSDLQTDAATRYDQVTKDFGLTYDDPDDLNKKALNEYYAAYDEATSASGILDFDKLDDIHNGAGWSPEQQQYIATNTGQMEGSHPPLIQEYLRSRSVISDAGYWDAAEGRERENLRRRNPAVDTALVLWYGHTPVTREARTALVGAQ